MSAATKSSPAASSGPSAESGGSRSKTAAEEHNNKNNGNATPGAIPDALAEGRVRGRTGGGEPLEGSVSAPPRPKITNASVPGDKAGGNGGPAEGLTGEQRREVEEHNREFEARHDRAGRAEDDRVDKKFWKGGGGRGE